MTQTSEISSKQPEFSVTEISNLLKKTIEDNFSHIRIKGEISGFKRAASGHLYFSLKDEKSVINAICWRGSSSKLGFEIEDGLEVIATGKLTTYAGRSNYQIIIDKMEIAGAGALMELLETRKKQFAAEGLFDPEHKKPLPYLPQIIGVVTSPTGAVIRDIIHRIEDRFGVHVLVWPVLVQGEGAAAQIANAIAGFNQMDKSPDLIIVARGGGSIEDLWAFNEEIVVRAAFDSQIPLISAVGHETDTTLIDYVSDKRAPTPTAAAEIAVPVKSELTSYILDSQKRLFAAISRFIDEKNHLVNALGRGLTSPQKMLENMMQRLDDWTERLSTAQINILANKRQLLLSRGNLQAHSINQLIEQKQQKLLMFSQLLESYHYKKVLERGFALVRSDEGIITSSKHIKSGVNLEIEFNDGIQKAIAVKGNKTKPAKRKPASPKDDRQESLF